LLEEETIVGRTTASVTTLSRALRRVDFAAIDRKVDVIALQRGNELVDVVDDAVASVVEELPEELTTKDVQRVVIKSSLLKDIQNTLKATLRDAWDVGAHQAKIEVTKAKRELDRANVFSITMARIDKASANYLDAQSFALTGEISDKAIKIIRNEILNGIKYSKTTEQVRLAIYERLASAGLISSATSSAVGAGLGLRNPSHAIDAIVRTHSFGAINEARHQYYTDPALGGFVVAYEYSSILDSRTTDICNELGGASTGRPLVKPINWPGWNKYRPPNHYNCRSLLIPITELDEWEESPDPTIEPQEGFG
jgi:hypothetical protein